MNKNNKIRVIATSIKGPMHLKNAMPCQDYFASCNKGKNFVAIVSDGAGSAKYGKIGAKIICETMVDILKNAKFSDIRDKIYYAIEVSRQKLLLHRFNKTKSQKNLMDFAATMLGVVYYKNVGIFFHIGDGAGIAMQDDAGEKFIATRPQNGDFSCETFFYTQDTWQNTLRFTPIYDAKSIILMTDGVTNFAFSKDYSVLEMGFVLPINKFLIAEENTKKAVNALTNTLDVQKARKLNSDDKTFLWARLR